MPRRPAPLPALIAIVVAIVVALAAPLAVTAADDTSLSDAQHDTLLRYARDTWAGFVAMTDPEDRSSRRQPRRRRHAERADVHDEHRRLHVEHGRRRGARASSTTTRRSIA